VGGEGGDVLMKLVKLTQCLEQDKSALHPVWVNPAFIVALDRTPFGTTQVRTAIGVGWVVETPEDIELQLLPIHFDVEMVNEKANEQAPVEGAYPPRARHTGFRDD
jgi:hypothetical protein